jgi:hypothetical protein
MTTVPGAKSVLIPENLANKRTSEFKNRQTQEATVENLRFLCLLFLSNVEQVDGTTLNYDLLVRKVLFIPELSFVQLK